MATDPSSHSHETPLENPTPHVPFVHPNPRSFLTTHTTFPHETFSENGCYIAIAMATTMAEDAIFFR